MAKYYKVTNVSGGTEKGPRGIFLIEAGKLLRPGQSAFNVRRVNESTRKRKDLEIEESSTPFKDLSDQPTPRAAAAPTSKVEHRVIEAPDGKVPQAELDRKAALEAEDAVAKPDVTAEPDGLIEPHAEADPPPDPEAANEGDTSKVEATNEGAPPKEEATNEGAPPKAKKKRGKKGKGSSSD